MTSTEKGPEPTNQPKTQPQLDTNTQTTEVPVNPIINYQKALDKYVKKAYTIATRAREKCIDPTNKVEIVLADDLSKRTEALILLLHPEVKGISETIQKLEKKHGPQNINVVLKITEEILKKEFQNKTDAISASIRTAFAYITMGVVSAPLEGISKIEINNNALHLFFAGPIRGAGGTASAMSIIIANHIRKIEKLDKYQYTPEEIAKTQKEIEQYHNNVTNLQYSPNNEEISILLKSMPIKISGTPTDKIKTPHSERNTSTTNTEANKTTDTTVLRGGMCLVLAEGIIQKTTKILKRIKEEEITFKEWEYLIDIKKEQEKKKSHSHDSIQTTIKPNFSYMAEMVAGRPVFAMPQKGFRLRYGRTRTTGLNAFGLNPATMFVLDSFIATGTQLRMERPGKAATITPCDSIEGPIVRLKNGTVKQINTFTEANHHLSSIEKILFLGDILISYGDFYENGHVLIPSGYRQEWYCQEI